VSVDAPADDLLARARQGDGGAFTELVRVHDARLRGLAYRLLGSRDAMDDVLQEAYVKAFRSLPRFRGDAEVGTWLHRIVANCCTDELRRAKRRPAPAPLADHALPRTGDHAERVGAGRDVLGPDEADARWIVAASNAADGTLSVIDTALRP
jgi:RNA polymerase sigma-70 factor, ECF subfamily